MMGRTESGVHVRAIARFDGVSIWFHWTTLLLIVAMFATAFARERASDGDSAAFLLMLHRSLGILLWLITLARLGWKALAGRSPALPPTISRVQRYAARMTEYGLFLLLMVQPVTGFLQSIAHGKKFALLGLSFPAVIARNRDLTSLFHAIHSTGALVLLGLIAIHAAAALLHHFVLRDDVLRAMLPGRRLVAQK
jgi:cytochrome b561